jgi:type VI secretion system protein ImpH
MDDHKLAAESEPLRTGQGSAKRQGQPEPRRLASGMQRAGAVEPVPGSVAARLFEQGSAFDFFQAVRLLERLGDYSARPDGEESLRVMPVGRGGPPLSEAVRFNAHLSLSFPASAIYEIERPKEKLPIPTMTVTFMGLTGPSGVLPQHYTQQLIALQRDVRGPERHALRAWLDLFNHRLISLFYRAWEKYRFYIPYERASSPARRQLVAAEDPLTRVLFSLVGLGFSPLRNRLHVSVRAESREPAPGVGRGRLALLQRVEDQVLLHYGGFLAHRPRCAISLEALLNDYFGLPVQVQQFQGQWLYLDRSNQSRLAGGQARAGIPSKDAHNSLGVDLVVGDRVWDVQGSFRVRLGPLRYGQLTEFLPDQAATVERKSFFLLCHLVRFYVGPELDFDVQLVLRADEVPPCQLPEGEEGQRLGWNTWLLSKPAEQDAEEVVFAGQERVVIGGS